jgi:hypothetical protein
MFLAELLGGLLARLADIVVIIPAIIIGVVASAQRSLAISFIVGIVVVLAVKLPAIADAARRLGIREPSYISTMIWYIVAVALWVGVVFLVRRALNGKWPIRTE